MTDTRYESWVALEAGADPAERTGELRRAHEAFTSAGRVVRPVRPLVAASWRRSARAEVNPDGTAGVELGEDELAGYREGHPLARAMPVIRELMDSYAKDGEHLVAVCDAQGRLLWVEGHPGTRRKAGAMNFVPGARWAESAVGTNAPGTALAEDRPVQVFSAEHFRRPVHPWTCAAAPLHDPRTGRLLGAVDITGGDRLAHPHSLAFVQAVARAAESELALLAPPPTGDTIELSALGRDEALLVAAGRKVRLSRRHSELLVLLGAVDITGGDGLAHPHSLAFVQAVARAAESELALLAPPPTGDTIELSALGRDEALLVAAGRKVRLSRRHSELLVLLARHPEGLTGDQVLVDLYEDESVTPVTVRAELSRLRRLLGPDLLSSRPYRLALPVDTDFDMVARRLGSGAVAAAMGAYAGPLLPTSQAPAVVRIRARLAGQLRAALIERGDPGLLADWARSPWGEEDVSVWRALVAALPECRRGAALARLRELDGELGAGFAGSA